MNGTDGRPEAESSGDPVVHSTLPGVLKGLPAVHGGLRREHMPTRRAKPWFAVKRRGYGAGLPIAWQGWLLLLGFVAALSLAGLLLPPLIFATSFLPVTAAFLLIVRLRSDGEWLHRGGE